MHKFFLAFSLFFVSLAQAGQFQIVEGDEALKIFNQLKGKKCIAYQTSYQIVYSRTDNLNCDDGNSLNEWQCTIQYEKNQKSLSLQSASCIKEID
jgi:hypothetical protein